MGSTTNLMLTDNINVSVSYSSFMEIVCQTEIAFELGYLTKDAFENISKKAKN